MVTLPAHRILSDLYLALYATRVPLYANMQRIRQTSTA